MLIKYCCKKSNFGLLSPAILFIVLNLWTLNILHGQNFSYLNYQERFDRYRKTFLQEKVYVHTDKAFYLSGEILWFKIYYVDGAFHKPLDVSKVAYVEILDKENKAVLQGKVDLREGKGSGSFYLPVNIESGNYRFRAYTRHMKNFSPEYFFEKDITIINTIKEVKPENIVSELPKKIYQAQFFPEGGNLVSGLSGKVAFKVTDQHGKGVDFKGYVINQQNDTIVRFKPLKFGIGNFIFTPNKENNYRVLIYTEGGNKIEARLPEIFEKGYVMNVDEKKDGKVVVKVSSNILPAEDLYLFAHTRQMIRINEHARLTNGYVEFEFDKNELGEGISHLTLFNAARQPVCERLLFNKPVKQLSVKADLHYRQFSSRQKVEVNLLTRDWSGKPLPADLSIAVYKIDSVQILDDQNITSYLWLSSDLTGSVESPEYYFGAAGNAFLKEATDNLMLTHGWRRFKWDHILKSEQMRRYHIAEIEGHVVEAKVVDKESLLPVEGVISFIAAPGRRFSTSFAKSNKEGKLYYNVKNYFGSNSLIVQHLPLFNSYYKIEIGNPFSEEYSSKPLPPYSFTRDMAASVLNSSVNMQVQNAFLGEKLRKLNSVHDSSVFYYRPEFTYRFDDYVRFTSMEEVLKEYVSEVVVRMRKNDYYLRLFNSRYKDLFTGGPLILIDGVPVMKNENKLMAYDPLQVEKLEIVGHSYMMGPLNFSGILSFTTYKGDLSGFEMDENTLVVDYEGLQQKREFYHPVYDTPAQKNSRIPDFRSLLYWSPEIQTENDGKASFEFYSSDQDGKYVVVVQGMSKDGVAGCTTLSFEVLNVQ